MDIYPTLCEIGGASLPANQIGDGVSLVSLFKGEVSNLDQDGQPRSLHWHFPAYLQSYANVNNEQPDPLFRARPCSVIRKGKWKLIQYFESGDLELYDLGNDLGETTNVATSNLATVDELFLELENWQQQTKAAIPRAVNPEFNAAAEAAAIQQMKSRKRSKKNKSKNRKAKKMKTG